MGDAPCDSLKETVRGIIAEALQPCHFFVAHSFDLEVKQIHADELAWEIFHGRLLDASQTREKQSFESWNVYLHGWDELSNEPLLSVKLDWPGQRLHVTRSIYCYAWEGFAEGNVIQSREVQKWVRELIATIDVPAHSGLDRMRTTLHKRLFQAVIGVSRLPLTSVEAPLPAFTLGQFAYFSQNRAARSKPMRSHQDLLAQGFSADSSKLEQAKLLEILLRSTAANELPDAAAQFGLRWQETGHLPSQISQLLLSLFDEVALSPYTDFVDKMLRFVELFEELRVLAAAQHADFLSALLRRIGRHLTAFDLVTFHHRGANYPDALLLDAALRALLHLGERHSDVFLPQEGDSEQTAHAKRLRRRGLRQGWLHRYRYEGHLVPDVPTSPGENARVMSSEFPRVPDEQFVNLSCRTRKLFADGSVQLTSVGQTILRQSVEDLTHPAELQELGMALFLDRPLGIFKRPGEPDQTALLSYEAFSPMIAQRQLQIVQNHFPKLSGNQSLLENAELPPGMPLQLRANPSRPGVPSLQDAFKIAPDFILLRTTQRAAGDFLAQFDWMPLHQRYAADYLTPQRRLLIVSGSAVKRDSHAVIIYDATLQPRLELAIDSQSGYATGDSCEFPRNGLQVVRAWQPGDSSASFQEIDVGAEQIWIRPRT
jgi:hypothetical protein